MKNAGAAWIQTEPLKPETNKSAPRLENAVVMISKPSMGLVFSVVIDHREKNLWLFCLLQCCFLSFPPSLQGIGSRAPHWSPCTAAQNVVHDLILKLGWTLVFNASWSCADALEIYF